MIQLKVTIIEYSSSFQKDIILPCDLRRGLLVFGGVDQVTNLDFCYGMSSLCFKHHIGDTKNIVNLNRILDEMNVNCPDMTIDILNEIMTEADIYTIFDEELSRKINENDYMMELIPDYEDETDLTYEQTCARYLAGELHIPFAKNVTADQLDALCSTYKDCVDWDEVWMYYELMGFHIINIGDNGFAFHWGNAE